MSDKFDFDEKQYQAFMRRLEQDFIITMLLEMKGGYSGARTSLVQIEPRDPSNARADKGKYILKVCLAEDAEREKQKHAKAKANGILGEHVPKLVTSISYEGIPLVGIFYQIAGEELLTRTTLQEVLEQRQTSQKQHDLVIKNIGKIADIILKWNFGAMRISETSDLLGSILDSIGGGERLKELEGSLKGIAENVNSPRIELTPLVEAPKYNPIHFLYNLDAYLGTSARQMPCLIPIGSHGDLHLHGDLHPGNVIVSKEEQSGEPFHIIDFASSRSGNVFFDLAYLEISILLNSRGGFQRLLDLEDWWELEQHLTLECLPSEARFRGAYREGLQRVLPIRRVIDARILRDGRKFREDYWIAFLAASVGAGLDLVRKVERNSSWQRIAFLTAISRFHHLVELLQPSTLPRRGQMAAIYFPGEEPMPPISRLEEEREKEEIPSLPIIPPRVQKRRAKNEYPSPIELVWPGEIMQRAALYDQPWEMIEEVWNQLTGKNDQGVLLLGERKFGKSSFFNCVVSLFPKDGGTFRAMHLNTLSVLHSAQSFAKELLEKMCNSIGLENCPVPYNSESFNSNRFFSACESVSTVNKRMRFVICIDEIDSTLLNSKSQADAREILQLLHRLLTDPRLPIRLLLTATDKERLREYPGGMDFVNNLDMKRIPQCSGDEVKNLIECFNVPVTFEKDALEHISKFSGGQIYFIKLPLVLAKDTNRTQANGKNRMKVDAQLVDKLIRDVIAPTSDTPSVIMNRHETVSGTMKDIYESIFFSEEERRFMRLLTEARGILKASSSEVSEAQLANIANRLSRRGYISKTMDEEGEEYRWRIGIWQLFLEDYYQLKYRRNRDGQ